MRIWGAVLAAWMVPAQSFADAATIRQLSDALQVPRLLDIFAAEATASADQIAQDFLGGDTDAVFAQTVARLHDPERLHPIFLERMEDALDPDLAAGAVSFFDTDLGRRVTDLEIAAREAMRDEAVEQAVIARVAQSGTPDLVQRMMREGDLVARNVEDTLQVIGAFYEGRREAGATEMSQADIAGLLEESRPGVTAETDGWLSGFLTLSYSPLAEDELAIYVDFWATETGRALEDALFEVFGDLFVENSYAVGQLVGRLEGAREL